MAISALVKADIKRILKANPDKSINDMDIYKLTSSQSNLNLDSVLDHMRVLGVKHSYNCLTYGDMEVRVFHFYKNRMNCHVTLTETNGDVIVSVI